ncbi:hypothetical protein LZ30DRAFT_717203 [Colletotrichum cereale]|nr:hypothetical protein LZ30DRAFT_717203 [Colletotrichum cereale]
MKVSRLVGGTQTLHRGCWNDQINTLGFLFLIGIPPPFSRKRRSLLLSNYTFHQWGLRNEAQRYQLTGSTASELACASALRCAAGAPIYVNCSPVPTATDLDVSAARGSVDSVVFNAPHERQLGDGTPTSAVDERPQPTYSSCLAKYNQCQWCGLVRSFIHPTLLAGWISEPGITRTAKLRCPDLMPSPSLPSTHVCYLPPRFFLSLRGANDNQARLRLVISPADCHRLGTVD